MGMWFIFIGSHAAFQRVYEDPIVLSRQPAATPEEKEIGETRANEVWKDASWMHFDVLCVHVSVHVSAKSWINLCT